MAGAISLKLAGVFFPTDVCRSGYQRPSHPFYELAAEIITRHANRKRIVLSHKVFGYPDGVVINDRGWFCRIFQNIVGHFRDVFDELVEHFKNR